MQSFCSAAPSPPQYAQPPQASIRAYHCSSVRSCSTRAIRRLRRRAYVAARVRVATARGYARRTRISGGPALYVLPRRRPYDRRMSDLYGPSDGTAGDGGAKPIAVIDAPCGRKLNNALTMRFLRDARGDRATEPFATA